MMASKMNDVSKSATGASADSSEFSQEKFECELVWCVQQLRLGLASQSATSRQAQEAKKVLKILQSSKSPMVKKRQAMRNTFGDYRKKMREEEVKSAAAAKKVKLSSGVEMGSVKSQFYKKSGSQSSGELPRDTTLDVEDNRGAVNQTCEEVQNTFKFNFNISLTDDDSGKVDEKENCENAGRDNRSQWKPTVCSSSGDAGSAGFTFERSDNAFKFNFSDSNKT